MDCFFGQSLYRFLDVLLYKGLSFSVRGALREALGAEEEEAAALAAAFFFIWALVMGDLS